MPTVCPLLTAGDQSGFLTGSSGDGAGAGSWANAISNTPDAGIIDWSPINWGTDYLNLNAQFYSPGGSVDYDANRIYLCFDTSGLSGSVISAKIKGAYVAPTGVQEVRVFEWNKTDPAPPDAISTADWTKNGSTNLGSLSPTQTATPTAFEISLNASGIALVNVGGYTFLMLKIASDFNGTPDPDSLPSDVASFLIDTATSITLEVETGVAAPTLLSPNDAADLNNFDLSFSWTGGTTPFTLQITKSTDTLFASPTIDEDIVSNSVLVNTLAKDNYIWRVKAYDSGYSALRSFAAGMGADPIFNIPDNFIGILCDYAEQIYGSAKGRQVRLITQRSIAWFEFTYKYGKYKL